MGLEAIGGLILVLISGGLMIGFSLLKGDRFRYTLRDHPALCSLKKAVGLSVEEGKRIHVSLGNSDLINPTNATALVGLSTLERVTQLSLAGDRPPVSTAGDGSLMILSQDAIRASYRTGNALDNFRLHRARLTGATPFSYIAGTLPVINDEQVSVNICLGNYGPEVALLSDASDRQNAYMLAGSDSLAAQAVLYAAAKEPLIGEEIFAVPAYIGASKMHTSSLQVQDILRWVVVLILFLGAGLKLLGIL